MKVPAVPSWLLLIAPVVVGVGVMVEGHAPIGRWGVHLAAGLLGLALFGALQRLRPLPPVARACLAIAGLLLIASTLLAPELEGVRRWHELGPLRVHPSALFGPSLLIFAAGCAPHRAAAHGLLLALQAVHYAQPDAGQATALGCGALGMLFADEGQRAKLPLAVLYCASVVACWLRPDLLPGAAFVEDIVQRAFDLGAIAGLTALVALALSLAAPVSEGRGRSRPGAFALVAYFAGALVATALGEFPVPLLGFGTSPAVGAFLGLAALSRRRAASADGAPDAPRRPRCPPRREGEDDRTKLAQALLVAEASSRR